MQAALCYARHVAATQTSEEAEGDAVDEQEDPLQQAAAEGLTLQRAPGTASGWKCVYRNGNRFEVRRCRRNLGTFDTAVQATLASFKKCLHTRLVIARPTAHERHIRS